eukprot:CAMPEP_0194141206 /NCGR_PEP_ID=MMETSP0152-20130528/10661_1 /TAXON_ID=1049557 /ORGANISM="Thalassiothrix antarctica, Strain L6-D1" /LENGTH=165 /DNA_ID=CAMNT_0038839755 /DNA_START=50 /DNA_END=547 /DNA_ORIENTATION=+
MLKFAALLYAVSVVFSDGFSLKPPKKANFDIKQVAASAFAVTALAVGIATAPTEVFASQITTFDAVPSTVVAVTETRQGVYGDYTVDTQEQKYDDAESTFKTKKQTKSKKGKYTALLAVLIMGSFIIPMGQYFWYVRDDDSSDRFFDKEPKTPVKPPKKKGFFGK